MRRLSEIIGEQEVKRANQLKYQLSEGVEAGVRAFNTRSKAALFLISLFGFGQRKAIFIADKIREEKIGIASAEVLFSIEETKEKE